MSDILKSLEIIETAIVIIADSHNPTILHPVFLQRHKIVPPSWKSVDDSVICSLPISRVEYENGFSIQAEPYRLQLRLNQLITDPGDSLLPEIAQSYLKALPEVKYTAIGLNLVGFFPVDNALEFVVRRFFVDGPWNTDDNTVASAGLRFEYPRGRYRANFRLDVSERLRQHDQAQQGLLVKTNYHCDIANNDDRLAVMIELLKSYKSSIDEAVEMVAKLIG